MTDSLRSVSQRAQVVREAVEEYGDGKKQGWWASMPAAARTGLLAALFLVLGVVNLVVGVTTLVAVTVSLAAGYASGGITLGIALFVIGVLFGLNS